MSVHGRHAGVGVGFAPTRQGGCLEPSGAAPRGPLHAGPPREARPWARQGLQRGAKPSQDRTADSRGRGRRNAHARASIAWMWTPSGLARAVASVAREPPAQGRRGCPSWGALASSEAPSLCEPGRAPDRAAAARAPRGDGRSRAMSPAPLEMRAHGPSLSCLGLFLLYPGAFLWLCLPQQIAFSRSYFEACNCK